LKKTLLAIAALSLILAPGCGKRENVVLAKVGDRKITVAQFEDASAKVNEKYLPKTNDQKGKLQLLNTMIDKEVMGLTALSAGYEKDTAFVEMFNKYKAGYAVAAMENEYIMKKVKVTDKEAQDYFDKMHDQYTLSQILVANEDDAINIREQLAGGADFAELAKKYSLSPEGAQGGFLGENAIGNMFYWIEDALLKMKEGDISQPLRTPDGWSVIKVTKIQKITPERDLAYARKKLEADKQKKMLEEMKAKIEKDIGLSIFPDAVNIIYNNLPPEINPADLMSGKVTRDNAPRLDVPEQYQDMLLAQYADGKYTVRDYIKIFDEMGLPERPTARQGREGVVISMHRKIWDGILPVYAENTLKVLEIPAVAKDLAMKKEIFLVNLLYQKQIQTEAAVSDLEVQDYYNAHKAEITSPEKRDYTIILMNDKETAEQVSALAKKGEDFQRLVKKYSQDPSAKENAGRTGLVQKGHFPDYDNAAFSLGLNQVSDAFQVPRGWAVIKVTQIQAPEQVPYVSAALSVKQGLLEQRADKLLQEKLAKWRKNFKIKIYEGNLKKAQLLKTRPSDAELEQKAREEQRQREQQQAQPKPR
jgi:peptidyl-prolyl cis-trans isomerase C